TSITQQFVVKAPTGTLMLTSVPKTFLMEGRVVRGSVAVKPNFRMSLAPGSWALVLENDYYSYRRPFTIKPGETTSVAVNAKPEYGVTIALDVGDGKIE